MKNQRTRKNPEDNQYKKFDSKRDRKKDHIRQARKAKRDQQYD